MRGTELLRLVWLNLIQNKFKTIMTSIGIVVGAATIVMVIAIGRGGQMDVAEQFSNLNAGAIDISYEYEGEEENGGFFSGGLGNFFSGIFGGMGGDSMPGGSGGAMPDMGSNSIPGGAGGGMPNMGENSIPGGNMPGFGGNSDGDSGFGGRGGGETPDFGGSNAGMPDMNSAEMPNFGSDSDADNGSSFGGSSAGMPDMDGAEMPNFGDGSDADNGSSFGGRADGEMPETEESLVEDRINQEHIILSTDDVEDIERFVTGITGVSISYSSRGSVEGGTLTSAQSFTIAGVKESYAAVSNLEFAAGEFLTETDDTARARVCVLGASAAKEIFGNTQDAYEQTIYIEDRTYTVIGVLETTGTVSGGISPDDAVFVPYETGIKYITGETISPTITVIAENVDVLDSVISQAKTVLEENYSNTEFTFADAGSKMEAAESSNRILTMLLSAMAVIVFIVGGIGIMNVLFVSVKERTSEIGILKSLGASRRTILLEFLLESAAISFIGGILGVALSFAVTPIVELYAIRVEASLTAWGAALGFAVLTGTLFGFYPAMKASRLVPVEALNAE